MFIFTDLFPSLLPRPPPSSSVLPAMSSGGRDGSVQSDASSSPSEQSQLGQSHPGYHMGPQVSEVTSNYSFIIFICKKVLQKKPQYCCKKFENFSIWRKTYFHFFFQYLTHNKMSFLILGLKSKYFFPDLLIGTKIFLQLQLRCFSFI